MNSQIRDKKEILRFKKEMQLKKKEKYMSTFFTKKEGSTFEIKEVYMFHYLNLRRKNIPS